MATTHALAGGLLGLAVGLVAPEHAGVAFAAGAAGGAVPDLDLYAGHRRTLHFPVYYTAAAVGASVLALAAPAAVTLGLFVFLAAAALHSLADVLGGGLELRPWLATSERAVYDHYHGRWLRPRRWVRYDGAPEDFLLAVVLAVAGLSVATGLARGVIVGLLVVSGGYAACRKSMVGLTEQAVGRVPGRYVRYLPERFVEGSR